MFNKTDAMRAMAERYLRLARAASEPNERAKFLDYASIYAQLSEQSERQDTQNTVAQTEQTKQK